MKAPREYTQGITLWPIDRPDYPMAVVLAYKVADPYAVQLAFVVPGQDTRVWTFSRGLLADALYAAAGEGDVRIGPHEDEDVQDYLVISLVRDENSRRWPAQFYVTREAIEKAVDRMYALVPMGREHVDVDQAIDRILSEVS
ncbi:SsgA family sporulation/cell division regulator [Herbidospora sp. NEAU-GS84]|uniref:SsgA family sporulation/cell division regulator n=1 Tax=Herbidospora solisilvae TaxID=2696284 RepID=A0A7C9J8S2_9ACTN|nr:SsgA family sporulation/cell division regulator [Herbidospora solisilvae]NAS27465.1 SsgA family sporulation/cell division regulator [Herbidospora solisilvae]